MKIITQPNEMQQCRQTLPVSKRVAFVPTMGNLHQGHLNLIRAAKKQADLVIVSIFVNPLQFGPTEDFAEYPRTFADDCQKLEQLDVDILFAPTESTLYPAGQQAQSRIHMGELAEQFCGKSRPGFFNGVATVVLKLFMLVQPNIAVFGAKDYQQTLIIKKLIADFHLPIELLIVPIHRESNGLAMSSRNQYLSLPEHKQAAMIHQQLLATQQAIQLGHRDFLALEQTAKQALTISGFNVDYFAICNSALQPAAANSTEFTVLTAAFLGQTRLIDNLTFKVNI